MTINPERYLERLGHPGRAHDMNHGTVNPGNSVGTLTMTGGYDQQDRWAIGGGGRLCNQL